MVEVVAAVVVDCNVRSKQHPSYGEPPPPPPARTAFRVERKRTKYKKEIQNERIVRLTIGMRRTTAQKKKLLMNAIFLKPTLSKCINFRIMMQHGNGQPKWLDNWIFCLIPINMLIAEFEEICLKPVNLIAHRSYNLDMENIDVS